MGCSYNQVMLAQISPPCVLIHSDPVLGYMTQIGLFFEHSVFLSVYVGPVISAQRLGSCLLEY